MLLNERDILQIIKGASFLAGGGGGSCEDAYLMLDAFKKHHPGKKIEIELLTIDEMEDTRKAAGIAVMGAPTGGTNQDITPCIQHAFDGIMQYEDHISYTLPLELGGFNTFVAILVSLLLDLPMLDADCCGRAVPALDTTLSHINGCPTGPIIMADVWNNRVMIQPADPWDAQMAEELAVSIVPKFEQNAGIAGWVYTKEDMKDKIPEKTISLCWQIGRIMDAEARESIFDVICAQLGIIGKTIITEGRIQEFHTEQREGWDIGYVEITEGKRRYRMQFSNENMVMKQEDNGMWTTVATVPNILTIYDLDEHIVLTNEDLVELDKKQLLSAKRVCVGSMKAHEMWYQGDKNIPKLWERYIALTE